MKIIVSNNRRRTVYAFKEKIGEKDGVDLFEYYLSPVPETAHGRRPIGRFDSQQELEIAANNRNCKVEWLTN